MDAHPNKLRSILCAPPFFVLVFLGVPFLFLWGMAHMLIGFNVESSLGTFLFICIYVFLGPVVILVAPLYALIAWGNWSVLAIYWGGGFLVMCLMGALLKLLGWDQEQ